MATQFIKRFATKFPTSAKPHASPIYVDSDDNILKMIPAATGTTEVQVVDASSTQTLTNKTLTTPVLTTPTITNPAITGPTPVTNTSGTVVLVQATHANRTTVLSKLAGGTVALPATSGTGDVYRLVVGLTITSVSWVISKAGADVMAGGVLINNTGDTAAATADFYPTAGTTNTVTLAFADGAAKAGDFVEFQDIVTGTWAVRGVLQGEIDPVTPFSAV